MLLVIVTVAEREGLDLGTTAVLQRLCCILFGRKLASWRSDAFAGGGEPSGEAIRPTYIYVFFFFL